MIWEAINKCGGGVDYVTENILNEGMMRRGSFRYNERSYNTLILIDVERMHPETSEQLLRFVEGGGKLICVDTIPYKSLGLSGDIQKKDSMVKANFERIQGFGKRFVFAEPPQEGFIPWYDSLMRAEQLPHYMDIEHPDPYVMQNRYTTDDGSEMVFLCNTSRYHAHQTKIGFHRALTHRKHPWVWDLQTGERHPLSLNEDGSYDFDLGPVESMLIVFEKKRGGSYQKSEDRSQKTELKGWEVELVHARLDTTFETHFDTLFDLKDHPDYQHFAGTIIYRKSISEDELKGVGVTNQGCILDLGLVEGVSEVIVNGHPAGVRYYGRRIYDIGNLLHEGDNELEIRVTTTLGNYLKTLSKEENPTTWVYVNHPRRDQGLQAMGLVGPVTLYAAY